MKKYFLYPEYAYDANLETIISKDQVLQQFSEMITSPNLKDALYLPEQNELKQYKEGMTTFVVVSDDIINVYIHENNYEMCKDEVATLTQMVSRAQELLHKDTELEIVNDDSKLSLS